MSVGSVLICLQASRSDGQGVTTREFLNPLAIQSDEVDATHADGGAWASGTVYFAVIRLSDFSHIDNSVDAGAQSEAFFAGLGESFRATAKFFDQRSPTVTQAMRTLGMSLRLLVDVRMDQDQMELELPPELLVACGRHGIGIYIISNDIPAAEVR